MLPEKVNLDIDSTGLIANGKTYTFNRKGYFSKRRGERGYQLSLCISSLTTDILVHNLMPGNHHTPSDFIELIYSAAEVLGSFDRIGIIRSDSAYGTAINLDFLIDHDLHFVIKGCNSKSFKDIIANISPVEWEYVNNTMSIFDAGERKIPQSNNNYCARVIILKYITPKGKIKFAHIYTTLSWDATAIFKFLQQPSMY